MSTENQQEEILSTENLTENLNEGLGSESESSVTNSEETTQEVSLEKELAEWKDKYLRLFSDFENFRKRQAKERIELIGTASESLMVSLLPVIDDFERSMKALETTSNVDSLKEGVQLVFHKFQKTLEQKGLKAMQSIGEPFNPELQEAITQIPVEDASQKGKVIDEVEKGYSLNEKTIRFAKVVIGA
jgi:molecular chaperone GrpE